MENIPFDGVSWSFYNEHGELVELDVFYFPGLIKVSALLCEDKPTYRDYVGEGEHRNNRKKAIQAALINLNRQVYGERIK